MANAKNVKTKSKKQQEYFCHDCGQKIKIEKKNIKNGKLLDYQVDGKRIQIVKCNVCYKKNPALTNFRGCEVYSRIVGYLRPVQQWNQGKNQEFGDRKEFVLKKGCC